MSTSTVECSAVIPTTDEYQRAEKMLADAVEAISDIQWKLRGFKNAVEEDRTLDPNLPTPTTADVGELWAWVESMKCYATDVNDSLEMSATAIESLNFVREDQEAARRSNDA